MLGIRRFWRKVSFSSSKYWEDRYRRGGSSGAGSYDLLSQFKAGFINDFVKAHEIQSAVEFGCGDGNQLNLFEIPAYLGLDVSETAIENCRKKFDGQPSKAFELYKPSLFDAKADYDLSLSLDVLYHLVEDQVYFTYLKHLTQTSKKWIVIYSCNHESDKHPAHVRPRKFLVDLEARYPEWKLHEKLLNPYPLEKFGPRNGSWSDFYVFRKA